jgi:hypothetical protein
VADHNARAAGALLTRSKDYSRSFLRLAAGWTSSSFNTQQWRALYRRPGTEHCNLFFELLGEGNTMWAKNAAVFVVFISRKNFEYDNRPSVTHSYDAGPAWEKFALQSW